MQWQTLSKSFKLCLIILYVFYVFPDISAYNDDTLKRKEYVDLSIYALLTGYKEENVFKKKR